ncbi:MAG: TMEM165/GDT1 family protein [Lachnospiraceae bacterium]
MNLLLFFKILGTEFIAEMGDKTQLMLAAMTSKYKLRDIILGTAAAILVLNGMAVLAGGLVSEFIPTWLIRLIAAFAFLYFALSSLKKEDEEEAEVTKKGSRFATLTVFSTFFVAELGDKTQLTAITFGANEGLQAAVIVWLACSIGLFAADIIGMLIGYFLQSKTPDGFLNTVAFFIFAFFGIITLRQGLILLLTETSPLVFPVTMGIAVLFILASIFLFVKNRTGNRSTE